MFLVLGLAGSVTNSTPRANRGASPRRPNAAPVLINTCLITNDVNKLASFYAKILQMQPHQASESYFEFQTTAGVLALFAADAQEKYIPGSATPGQNHSSILEFRVDDVDQEYQRLREFVKPWVKGPTTQPWVPVPLIFVILTVILLTSSHPRVAKRGPLYGGYI